MFNINLHRWHINAAFYAPTTVNQTAACVARKNKIDKGTPQAIL